MELGVDLGGVRGGSGWVCVELRVGPGGVRGGSGWR